MLGFSPSRKVTRLRAEIAATTLPELKPDILNDSGNSIGVITSIASVSGQFFGLGLINNEHPIENGNVYLCFNGSSMPVEVLSIPYSAVIDA